MKEKVVKPKRKGPPSLDFNAWHKKQMQKPNDDDDKNEDSPQTECEKEIDDIDIKVRTEKKRKITDSESHSVSDTGIDNSKYKKKVNGDRKKRKGLNYDNMKKAVPVKKRKLRDVSDFNSDSEVDADIGNKKKIDLDTDSENNLFKCMKDKELCKALPTV